MNDPLNDAPSGLAIPQALPPASGLDQYLRLADAYLQARRRGQDFSLESFFNGGMGNDVARGQPLQPSPAAPAGGGEAVDVAPVAPPEEIAAQEAQLTPAAQELPPEAAELIAAVAQQEAAAEPSGPTVVATGFKTKKAAMNALKKLGPGHRVVKDGDALAIITDEPPPV